LNVIWHLIVFGGIIGAWCCVLSGLGTVFDTTLKTAWGWSLAAATVWATTWFTDRCACAISSAWADHAWYACAVLSLCPPIAVLGSRRPGTRVWTWFILFPMLLALSWPIAALWLQGSELRNLQLETPQLVAFCLVLIMGVGNYFGTRFTLPAMMYGASILALVVSTSAESPRWLADRAATRLWCTLVLILAIGLVKSSPRRIGMKRIDRLWLDFFDLFGIVWGRRIQDRVNFIANLERLPVSLELDGFVWGKESNDQRESTRTKAEQAGASEIKVVAGDSEIAAAEARIEHIMRWLLRRFVDAAWIDRRLDSKAEAAIIQMAADS
jgi:hypothetical protein